MYLILFIVMSLSAFITQKNMNDAKQPLKHKYFVKNMDDPDNTKSDKW